MNKLIQRILSNKVAVVILVILLLVVIAYISYTVAGIQKNVEKMTSPEPMALYFPDYPAVTANGRDPEIIKRGEYLVKAGDCIACHTNTPLKGPSFAGGLPMQTPFGIIYSPNITPDKETGIGNWTEEQFIKAMRAGISPGGHYYYPAFPYLFFNRVTTEDLKAIKAYLDSIPAVHEPNHENTMMFPFNWRFMQLGWRLLFFDYVKKGPYVPNPQQSVDWNRGAYLVEGLGHCAMCHTPSYTLLSEKIPLGAPIHKYHLTGNTIQGYLAPNITKTNLGAIPDEELINVFTKDILIGGRAVSGPMLEANHDSLAFLTRPDLLAIITYLKTIQSQLPEQPDVDKGTAGKIIYDSYCSGCHATGAGGAPLFGDTASWGPLARSGMNKLYSVTITGMGSMPPKGTCANCSNREIKQAVDYMVLAALAPKSDVSSQVHATSKAAKLTPEEGKRIYEESCSICHASGFKNAPKPGDIAAWKPIINAGFLKAYVNVVTGREGHPPRGACSQCSDDQLLAAVKYMMQKSAPSKNFNLW